MRVKHSSPREVDADAGSTFATLVCVDDALDLVCRQGPLGRIEQVRLADAGGRILAQPIVAHRNAPSNDVSAMDGYAVRDADLGADWTGLRVIAESYPGQGFDGELAPATCVRIFTGAPTPAGTDRVVVQEAVRRSGDRVFILGACLGKRHVRQMGSDFKLGDTLVPTGAAMTPQRLVAAAAVDAAALSVVARPRVVILATGDELRTPGEDLGRPDAIPESVTFGVAEMARRHGAEVQILARIADDLGALRAAVAKLLATADIMVVIGGASVGERDFSRAMFAPHGLRIDFSKVAMRPGKPVWFGEAFGAKVLGLPGNPTAALVTARLFLAPLVAGMAGRGSRSALNWRWQALAADIEPTQQWECFIGARQDGDRARPIENRSSSAQKALAETDLLIRRPAGLATARAGERVETLDF
jgi:molybdopterin molybdotransferase